MGALISFNSFLYVYSQQELEEAAKKPDLKKEEEVVPQPKHQSPAQKIYAENRVFYLI